MFTFIGRFTSQLKANNEVTIISSFASQLGFGTYVAYNAILKAWDGSKWADVSDRLKTNNNNWYQKRIQLSAPEWKEIGIEYVGFEAQVIVIARAAAQLKTNGVTIISRIASQLKSDSVTIIGGFEAVV